VSVKTEIKNVIHGFVKEKRLKNPKYTLQDWLAEVAEVYKSIQTQGTPAQAEVLGEAKPVQTTQADSRKNVLDSLTLSEVEYLLNNPTIRDMIRTELMERKAEQTAGETQ